MVLGFSYGLIIAVALGAGIYIKILYSCSQIYYKVYNILYTKRTFQFDYTSTFELFWRNFRPDTALKILLFKVIYLPGQAITLDYGNNTKPVKLLLAGHDRLITNNIQITEIQPLYQENIL